MLRSSDPTHAIAAQFEHIVLPDSDGCFTTKLYAVEGRLGVFKRLAMSENIPGSFKAWYNGGFIRLTEASGVNSELAEAFKISKEETSPLFKETE